MLQPIWQSLARDASVLEAFERIPHIFCGSVNSDPGCSLNEALHMAVGGGEVSF